MICKKCNSFYTTGVDGVCLDCYLSKSSSKKPKPHGDAVKTDSISAEQTFRFRFLADGKIRWAEEVSGKSGAYILDWDGHKLVRGDYIKKLSKERLRRAKSPVSIRIGRRTLPCRYISEEEAEERKSELDQKREQRAKDEKLISWSEIDPNGLNKKVEVYTGDIYQKGRRLPGSYGTRKK